jgi:hypothetical protein
MKLVQSPPADVTAQAPIHRLRGALERAGTVDFTRPPAAVVLALVYVLSRLPWITIGYGSDPDTSRVAISAWWLWNRGEYLPSRLPGYPLFELAVSALYPLGPTVMNAATLVVSFAGVLLFAAILKQLRIEPKGWLTVTYAFAPMVWINSSITLDYLWGITFILAAYLLLLHGREPGATRTIRLGPLPLDRHALLAGVCFGIAIGCRPTSALMALPFFILLGRRRQFWPLVSFYGAAGVVGFVAFLPITLVYGLDFLDFFDVRPTWKTFARTLGVEAFGMVPLLGILLVTALSWRRLLELPHRLRTDVHLAMALLAVLLIVTAFMRLPLEEAYLAPAVPFALLAAARLFTRRAVLAVSALLVMGGLVDFHTQSDIGWRRPLSAVLQVRPERGRVLTDLALRKHRMKVVEGLREVELPPKSVITAGFYYPVFVAHYIDELDLTLPRGFRRSLIGPLTDGSTATDRRGITYVWLMKPGDARRYRAQGYRTYTMDLDGEDVLVTFETYLPEHEQFAVR